MCLHPVVSCINQYELIRKYRCNSCGEVMMCACEEDLARQYLQHQLSFGTDLHTRMEIPVTLGFQKDVCNACRGLPEEAHPKAPLYARTSKIFRYYWREIAFGAIPKFSKWAKGQGYSDWLKALAKHQDIYNSVEREVVEKIKQLHQHTPKYAYLEESQEEVLTKHRVEVIKLDGIYKKVENGTAVLDGEILYTPEEFVARYFERDGYKVLFTESVPFHALFGVFLWLLVQDPSDPNLQMTVFGDRVAFETGKEGREIWTLLPTDFGTSGYAQRRAIAIERYFAVLPTSREELLWTFDYWIEPSVDLRQYLWAHRSEDVTRAREITSILGVDVTMRILRYLLGDYWRRYCGWPDLLIYRQNEFFFAEVKSTNDKLSEDQKEWIRGNSAELGLPFKLVKIHRKGAIE